MFLRKDGWFGVYVCKIGYVNKEDVEMATGNRFQSGRVYWLSRFFTEEQMRAEFEESYKRLGLDLPKEEAWGLFREGFLARAKALGMVQRPSWPPEEEKD